MNWCSFIFSSAVKGFLHLSKLENGGVIMRMPFFPPQIWSKLFWLADANQGFDDYREFLAKELMNRARRVRGGMACLHWRLLMELLPHFSVEYLSLSRFIIKSLV